MDLRPATDDDFGFLYALAIHQPEQWMRVCSLGIPVWPLFERTIRHLCEVQYIVEVEGEPVGACALFEHDADARTAWVEVVTTGTIETRKQAGTLLVRRAFANWQLAKVYAGHSAFEAPVFIDLPHECVEEGRLTEHIRHRGRYWDWIITAAYADERARLDVTSPAGRSTVRGSV